MRTTCVATYSHAAWVLQEVANLTVVAGADPSLATADLIGAVKTLASTHGIQRVQCVAVDDSLFTAPDFPVSWEYEGVSC